ncbi:hypothetical protein V6N13_064341 [Hibiscus sabdariffa]
MYEITHLHRSQVDSELFTSVPSVNLELSNMIGGGFPATPSIKVKERSNSLPITREGLEIIATLDRVWRTVPVKAETAYPKNDRPSNSPSDPGQAVAAAACLPFTGCLSIS